MTAKRIYKTKEVEVPKILVISAEIIDFDKGIIEGVPFVTVG